MKNTEFSIYIYFLNGPLKLYFCLTSNELSFIRTSFRI